MDISSINGNMADLGLIIEKYISRIRDKIFFNYKIIAVQSNILRRKR